MRKSTSAYDSGSLAAKRYSFANTRKVGGKIRRENHALTRRASKIRHRCLLPSNLPYITSRHPALAG